MDPKWSQWLQVGLIWFVNRICGYLGDYWKTFFSKVGQLGALKGYLRCIIAGLCIQHCMVILMLRLKSLSSKISLSFYWLFWSHFRYAAVRWNEDDNIFYEVIPSSWYQSKTVGGKTFRCIWWPSRDAEVLACLYFRYFFLVDAIGCGLLPAPQQVELIYQVSNENSAFFGLPILS